MARLRRASYAVQCRNYRSVARGQRFCTASLGETLMKSLKTFVGLASTATLLFALTPVAYAANVTLVAKLDTTPQTLLASVQRPSCATPNSDARVAGTPFFEMPLIAEQMGNGGTSIVEVELQSNGALSHYALEQSSGNIVLDESALRTARMSRYQPETRNCVSIAGSYLLAVDF
jgi:TonB family protein